MCNCLLQEEHRERSGPGGCGGSATLLFRRLNRQTSRETATTAEAERTGLMLVTYAHADDSAFAAPTMRNAPNLYAGSALSARLLKFFLRNKEQKFMIIFLKTNPIRDSLFVKELMMDLTKFLEIILSGTSLIRSRIVGSQN